LKIPIICDPEHQDLNHFLQVYRRVLARTSLAVRTWSNAHLSAKHVHMEYKNFWRIQAFSWFQASVRCW